MSKKINKYHYFNVVLIITLFFYSKQTFSQIYDPVSWKTQVEKISDTEFELVSTATIEPGWHMYALNLPDGGPVATSFNFPKSDSYQLVGEVSQQDPISIFDDIFDMETSFFELKAEFRQKIKVTAQNFDRVEAEVNFMVCNDLQCLPPENESLVFKMPFKLKKENDLDSADSSKATKDSSKLKNSETDKSFWGIFILSFLSGRGAGRSSCSCADRHGRVRRLHGVACLG